MRRLSKWTSLVLALVVIGLSGCGGAKLSPETQQAFASKQEMYAQQNMYIMVGKYGHRYVDATNYALGTLIPVNSKITLKDVNSNQFSFVYQGQVIILKNIPKYTGLNISQLAERYFAPKQVDLSKFSAVEKAVIAKPQGAMIPGHVVRHGPFGFSQTGGYGVTEIKAGMSKAAVLAARGYPPIHGTQSLEANTWKYWETRHETTLINFENNKVVSVGR